MNPAPSPAARDAIEQLLALNEVEKTLMRRTAPLRWLRNLSAVVGWASFGIELLGALPVMVQVILGMRVAADPEPFGSWLTWVLVISMAVGGILWAGLRVVYRPLERKGKVVAILRRPELGALRRVPCLGEFIVAAGVSDQAAWDAAALLEEYARLAGDAQRLRGSIAPEDDHHYTSDEIRRHAELSERHGDVKRRQADLARRIADLLQGQTLGDAADELQRYFDTTPLPAVPTVSSEAEATRVHALVQSVFGTDATCLVEWRRPRHPDQRLGVDRIQVGYRMHPRLASASYRDRVASDVVSRLEGDWIVLWDVARDGVVFEREPALRGDLSSGRFAGDPL
ncbi:hypothetical protein [Microbacterium panaciterrae]|uniref:hypothetical protein n=1 Tax=Microbacterium panaciterrae TaxID=985759 RepID=UPI0031EFA2E5